MTSLHTAPTTSVAEAVCNKYGIRDERALAVARRVWIRLHSDDNLSILHSADAFYKFLRNFGMEPDKAIHLINEMLTDIAHTLSDKPFVAHYLRSLKIGVNDPIYDQLKKGHRSEGLDERELCSVFNITEEDQKKLAKRLVRTLTLRRRSDSILEELDVLYGDFIHTGMDTHRAIRIINEALAASARRFSAREPYSCHRLSRLRIGG